jgi:hypothetical protein
MERDGTFLDNEGDEMVDEMVDMSVGGSIMETGNVVWGDMTVKGHFKGGIVKGDEMVDEMMDIAVDGSIMEVGNIAWGHGGAT